MENIMARDIVTDRPSGDLFSAVDPFADGAPNLNATCGCCAHRPQPPGAWTGLPDGAAGDPLAAPAGSAPDPLANGAGSTTVVVAASGDQRIDALIDGRRWSGSITYADPDASGDYTGGYSYDSDGDGVSVQNEGFSQLGADQMEAVHAILNVDASLYGVAGARSGFSVEGFTNLGLSYNGAGSGTATIRVANSSDPGTSYAWTPQNNIYGGDTWFGPSARDPLVGNYDYHTTIHELGHALGLKHGHETGGFGALPSDTDSMEYSVMTYKSYVGDNNSGYNNEAWGYAQTFMMYDIAALQYMYGADYSANSGNTTYRWDPLTGQTFIDGALALDPGGANNGASTNRIFQTVWDGGGVDTYDLTAYATDMTVNLQAGGHSKFSDAQRAYLGGGPNGGYARGNVFNALLVNGDTRSLIENVWAGSGDDNITGNEAANQIKGGGGSDSLYGLNGDDTLYGQDGDDFMKGGGGADLLYGGAGDDTLGSDLSGSDTLYGEGGDDYLYAVDGFDSIDGGAGVDTLNTTSFDGAYLVNLATGTSNYAGETFLNIEKLYTGDGNDTLIGSVAANLLNGGVGDDSAVGGDGNDTLEGGAGNDTLVGEYGDDVLNGGAGDDSLLGGAGDDSLVGGDGNDTLNGGGGADTALGGAGDDYIHAVLGVPETIDGGSGVDTLNTTAFSGDYVVDLTTGLTNFVGESFVNMENIYSGAGNDVLTGTSGNNTMKGGGGADSIVGGAGNDCLWGEAGDDTLNGGGGQDTAFGGDGDDLIFAVLGVPETIDGGAGVDTLDTTAFGGNYAVNLATGVTNFAGESFVNMENIVSGAGADTLTGTAGANAMDGGGGADSIRGEGGDDVLTGGSGNDILIGGIGNDVVDGGNGNDVVFAGLGADVAAGGAGTDRIDLTARAASTTLNLVTGATNVAGESLTGFENATMGAGADTVTGTAGANVILGGGGSDTVSGQGGDDVLRGEAGDDWLAGNGGDDLLQGGDGSDRLDGSVGADTLQGGGGVDTLNGGDGDDLLEGGSLTDFLNGGAGADILVGGSGVDQLQGAAGSDVFRFLLTSDSAFGAFDSILGFDGPGAAFGDLIDLSEIDANVLTAADDAFVFGFQGTRGLWLGAAGTDTVIWGNTDADAAAELEIRIVDGGVLASAYSAADFIV
jgi:serralysin